MPVQAYFAQTRRQQLADDADFISRSIADDIHTALPFSVRQRVNGSYKLLDMIRLDNSGEFMAIYTPAPPGGPDTAATLYEGQNDSAFSIIGRLGPNAAGPTPLAGRLAIIANTATIYTDTHTFSPSGAATVSASGANGESVTLSAPFQFTGNASKHIFLIKGTVAYLCDTTAGTLTRYEGFPIGTLVSHDTPAKLTALSTSSSLIAQNVSSCSFLPYAATLAQRTLTNVQIKLTNNKDSVPIFEQFAEEQRP
jgi:MSHA biogenesis protein MshO